MKTVRLSTDYDLMEGNTTYAFKKDTTDTVTDERAEALVAAGVATIEGAGEQPRAKKSSAKK